MKYLGKFFDYVRRRAVGYAAAASLLTLSVASACDAESEVIYTNLPIEPPSASESYERCGYPYEMFDKVNEHREDNGEYPLGILPELEQSAQNMAESLANSNHFSHVTLDGKNLTDFMREAGIDNGRRGENLARNNYPSDQIDVAIGDWKRSEGHNANMLHENYIRTGVGVAYDPINKMCYFVQHFWGG